MPATHWTLTTDASGIALLTIDKAGESANSLSRAVMEELNAHLDSLHAKVPRGLVVTSAK